MYQSARFSAEGGTLASMESPLQDVVCVCLISVISDLITWQISQLRSRGCMCHPEVNRWVVTPGLLGPTLPVASTLNTCSRIYALALPISHNLRLRTNCTAPALLTCIPRAKMALGSLMGLLVLVLVAAQPCIKCSVSRIGLQTHSMAAAAVTSAVCRTRVVVCAAPHAHPLTSTEMVLSVSIFRHIALHAGSR
jgi:hypothetical protein